MPTPLKRTVPPGKCSVCGKQYKRSSHLRRHETTHAVTDQYQCPYCSKAFARRDVCRKHVIGCPKRTTINDLPLARRGQKPRACDSCFKSKVQCDNVAPCSRCTYRQFPCTYSRTVEHRRSTSLGPGEGTTQTSVDFLLGLVDPAAKSMVETVPGGSDQIQQNTDNLEPATAVGVSPLPDYLPVDFRLHSWGLDLSQPGEFSETLFDGFMDYGIEFDESSYGSSISREDERLVGPIARIIADLRAVNASFSTSTKYSGGGYVFNIDTLPEVLTPASLRTHIAAYFRYTHPDYPIIHCPTFEMESTLPTLLVCMFLCGSLYCGKKGVDYRGFYDIAEEYAFNQLHAAVEASYSSGNTVSKDVAAILQAATLMNDIQWVIRSPSSRRRIRLQRLPALVYSARTLGYTSLRHAVQNPEAELDWVRFIELEICIRIGIFVVRSDWRHGGVFNAPCMTTIHEMTGHLPCVASLWDAKDETEFRNIIQSEGVKILYRPYSVRSLVEGIMKDEYSMIYQDSPHNLTMGNLSIVIDGIHVLIASARLNRTLPLIAHKALRALSRWQDLWNAALATGNKEEIESSPLAKHSPQLCWLARRIVEVSASGKEDSAYFRTLSHESSAELHALIRELRGG